MPLERCAICLVSATPTNYSFPDVSVSFVGNSPVVRGDTVTFDLSLGSGVTAVRCALLVGDRIQNETDCKFEKRELK